MISNYRGKGFLVRLIAAAATGQDKESFVDQEMRIMMCQWCADGWPLKDGKHTLLGITMPCEAERGQDATSA